MCAMSDHLAQWVAYLVLDAQLARNSLFPEAAHSPVVGLGSLAVSAALDHLLLFENCPLRSRCQRLLNMAVALGPAMCDVCGALSEGDAVWVEGTATPAHHVLAQELELLRLEMTQALPEMVQWRLTLPRGEGIRYDRFQHCVIITIDDLTYHDTFQPLQVIRDGVSRLQTAMQNALIEQSRALRGEPPAELNQSQ